MAKYIDSDYALAKLLREFHKVLSPIGSTSNQSNWASNNWTIHAFGGLRAFCKAFKDYVHYGDGITYRKSLLTADLSRILTSDALFAFDLCVYLSSHVKPVPLYDATHPFSHHPAYNQHVYNRLDATAFYEGQFTFVTHDDGTRTIEVTIPHFGGSRFLTARPFANKLTALLTHDPTAAMHPTSAFVSSSSSIPINTTLPSIQAGKISTTHSQQPQSAAPSSSNRNSTISSSSSSTSLKPGKPPQRWIPGIGLLVCDDRAAHYVIRTRGAAACISTAILDMRPPRIALAAIGDLSRRDFDQAIDVIQLAFTHPDSTAHSMVFIWDFARCESPSDYAYMYQALVGVLHDLVESVGSEVVMHGSQAYDETIMVQGWFDASAVVDTNVVFDEWTSLANEANGLAAVLDQRHKDSGLPVRLSMSDAKRALLIVPALDESRSVNEAAAATAPATAVRNVAPINSLLKACQRPINNLYDRVVGLIERSPAFFCPKPVAVPSGPPETAKHDNESDDSGTDVSPVRHATADTDETASTASSLHASAPLSPTTAASTATTRKSYWDLSGDRDMLTKAAVQDVDQLIRALDVMEARIAELSKWVRRARSYLTATQFMHGKWSVNPRLPKHVAVQARYAAQGQLVWRYPKVAGNGQVSCDTDQEEEEACEASGKSAASRMDELGLYGASPQLRAIHKQFNFRTQFEVWDLLDLLPDRVRAAIDAIPDACRTLNEVILDLGEPPRLRFFGQGLESMDLVDVDPISQADIEAIVRDRKFSSDRRGGINGQLHRISWVANREGKAIGLTIRVGRACPPGEGVTQMLLDLVKRGESVLFLGKPGSGKTHTLRDFVARLSDTGNNVMIVDTSNEVGGPGDVKHFSLHKARRLQVRDRSRQFEVLLEAVQNHTPDIVCIDEISDAKEVAAARSVATRVQAMVATAHGDLESILRNSVMRDLVGGLQTATVGDARAKELGGHKNVTTRARDSLFMTVVELVSRTEVRVFRNVNQVVDDILHPRGFPWAERRWLPVPTPAGARRSRAKSRGGKTKKKEHGAVEAEVGDGDGGGGEEGGGDRGGTKAVVEITKHKKQEQRSPTYFMARLEPFQKPNLELPAA